MAQRVEAPDSLDDFPTPPWATRALFECVFPTLPVDLHASMVWEPAANRGLMAEVIAEYSGAVFASDVQDYGYAKASLGSFVGEGPDVIDPPADCDAVVTNPPFRLAIEFCERALREAPLVALLLRTSWIEGGERYERIFRDHAPAIIAFFCERVPMVQGRWDPEASTATSYAWFVWAEDVNQRPPLWIPPGQRRRLSRPGDKEMARRLGALVTGPNDPSQSGELFK